MKIPFCLPHLPALFLRLQHHHEVIPLALDRLFYLCDIREALHEFIELLNSVLFIRELSSTHHDRHLHHVALGEELTTTVRLTIEIANIRTEAEANDLHFCLFTMSLLLFILLLEFVKIATVITNLRNGWYGLGRYFDEIHPLLLCFGDGIGSRHLLRRTVIGNDENLWNANLFIKPWFLKCLIVSLRGIPLSQKKRGKSNNGYRMTKSGVVVKGSG